MARRPSDSPRPLPKRPAAALRPPPDYTREAALIAAGAGLVAGCDEVGRGPLAGPVVAAAVILDPARLPPGLADSKTLKAAQREAAFAAILESALAVSVASRSAASIDRLNIRAASLLAMTEAVRGLALAPGHVLVDGRDVPAGLPCPATALIGGDGLSASIAAASIVAKVLRDRMMSRADALFPGYGFPAHAGYPTPSHKAAIAALGPCPIHRMSFRPLSGR
ncbi:ribonuclease HII [Antarcticirhabdus aurantiaca]|uniref:Ribonuclease HII n=1 Tax=Antarcticirhabdus aurantiaca TaxID=2606717 RepID=A0ACD4NSS4_9HYPH|nr:ribonuclease HII [Antarcticirhabdus aurantiaca]WAJ29771.1 ribonuclease HII [Jeongeuplla avenae]